MRKSHQILFMTMIALILSTSAAQAEWHFGIGTGLGFTNIDGEQGFNSALAGPVKFDVKLDPKDFNDVMKTAIGFGGYATNGTYMIQYSYAQIELEDTASETLSAINSTATVKINFKTKGAELTVGYPVYQTSSVVVLLDGGVRYTKHEFDNSLTLSGAVTGGGSNSFDNSWTDFILGASVNVPFAAQWSWNSRFNAGYGGSDGTYFLSTGVTWRFHKNWSTSLVGRYVAVKYENGNMGDTDWYYYDADESNIGLNILFNW